MLWLARRHEPRDGLGPFAAGASPAPLPRTSEVSFMEYRDAAMIGFMVDRGQCPPCGMSQSRWGNVRLLL